MHNNTNQWAYKPKYFWVVYTKKVLRLYVGVRPLREGSHLLGISLMSVELSQGHHNNITEEPRYTLESRSYRSSGDSLAEGYLGESLFSLRLRRSAVCSPPSSSLTCYTPDEWTIFCEEVDPFAIERAGKDLHCGSHFLHKTSVIQ